METREVKLAPRGPHATHTIFSKSNRPDVDTAPRLARSTYITMGLLGCQPLPRQAFSEPVRGPKEAAIIVGSRLIDKTLERVSDGTRTRGLQGHNLAL